MVNYKVLIGLGLCLFLLAFGFARLGYFGAAKSGSSGNRKPDYGLAANKLKSGNDKMNDMLKEMVGQDSRLSQEQKNKLMKMLNDPSKRGMILNKAMPKRNMSVFEQIMSIFGFGPQPKKYNSKHK